MEIRYAFRISANWRMIRYRFGTRSRLRAIDKGSHAGCVVRASQGILFGFIITFASRTTTTPNSVLHTAKIHASPDLSSLHLARKYCELPPTAYFPAVECQHTRHRLETNLDARRAGFIRFSPFQDSNLRISQNFRLLADSVLTRRVGYREDMFILLGC